MSPQTQLRGLVRRVARSHKVSTARARLRLMAARRAGQRHAGDLAREFGTSEKVMATFIARFAPSCVAPDQFREDADTMLFVHIPKTAGVSVGKALQQCFDHFHGVEWDRISASFRQATHRAAYEQTRAASRQVIMGHFGWNEIMVWRNHDLPLKCGTILRNPVERLISNYNYNCSDRHPARENFMQRFPTIESYARGAIRDVQLTQAIGYVASFEGVLLKLLQNYSFIGLTERLPQSLAHLSRSHGLPQIPEYHDNVGTRPADGLHQQVSEFVHKRNHNDIKIHQLMMRLYDLAEET